MIEGRAHIRVRRPCGCLYTYFGDESRWAHSIEMCRHHWNEMQVDWWLQEWTSWGRFTDTPQERNALAQMRFWACRCSF